MSPEETRPAEVEVEADELALTDSAEGEVAATSEAEAAEDDPPGLGDEEALLAEEAPHQAPPVDALADDSHAVDEAEVDFLDARPETARLEREDLEEEHEDADGPADDLVFYDGAADSGLDIQVIAPPRAAQPAAPATPVAPAAPAAPPPQAAAQTANRRATGRHRISSGRLRAATEGALERRQRPAEDVDAALRRLQEQAPRQRPNDPFAGKELGPFRAERLVSIQGGVRDYLGVDPGSQELILLRVVPLKKDAQAAALRQLSDHVERSARVAHPSLATCLGTGRTRDCFFSAYEVPVGNSLEELEAPLEEREVLEVIRQVAAALKALHAKETPHANVCPANILREREGVYVLAGAGWARPRPELAFLSAGGDVRGTPGFLAPEDVDLGASTCAGDLYGLGCVAWGLLAGRRPWSGEDPADLLADQLSTPLPDLTGVPGVQVSAGLATIIRKLTGRSSATRYASVADLEADLQAMARGESPQDFPADATADPFARPPRRASASSLLLLLLLLLDLALAVSLGLAYAKTRRMHLEDPVAGYELPLPGVSEGGYGNASGPR